MLRITLLACLFMTAASTACGQHTGYIAMSNSWADANEMHRQNDYYRAHSGRQPLRLNDALCAAAREKSYLMAYHHKMSHGIGGGHGSGIARAGYRAASAGENIAYGQSTITSVTSTWWHSPGHKANMLGNWQECGFAGYRDQNGTWWWTGIFANPSPSQQLQPVATVQPCPNCPQPVEKLPDPKRVRLFR